MVSAYSQNELIGCGRIVSDGYLHAFITEMIIHPCYQRQGVGKNILNMLISKCFNAGIRDIQLFCAKGKIIATVCSAAFPLGKSGILKNRKATTYHLKNGYYQEKLKEFGVNVVNEPIVVDGNIITSYCPETAPGVAFELLKMLTSQEEMAVIKKAMGF
jgi:GNAT superfamily N-acetyltransferase